MTSMRQKQTALSIFLILFASVLLIYTVLVVTTDGWNFLDVVFKNLWSLNWSGQFTLDFCGYLVLSGWWIAWRHQYSRVSVLTGVAAIFLGMLFFAPYLLHLVIKEKGDMKAVLVGRR